MNIHCNRNKIKKKCDENFENTQTKEIVLIIKNKIIITST